MPRLSAAAAAMLACLSATAAASAAEKPNLVLILLDDLGYGDIGPFGGKANRTPALDRMAAEGVKLTACGAAAANIDILPTFVGLAGGSVPADRKTDGKDIWPLLSGAAKESPHEALYFFHGTRLEAVRSGPWKLRLTGASSNEATLADRNQKRPPLAAPQLYNVAEDIGEKSDVAAANPEVVARLTALAEKMDADLGITKAGPGVREPGRSSSPKPLLMNAAK